MGYCLHSSLQLLEEVCQKNNWGPPIYNLHSTSSQTQSGEDVLFLFKVTITALGMTYMPNKLSRTVEEARAFAADYTLTSLGYPFEGVCVCVCLCVCVCALHVACVCVLYSVL